MASQNATQQELLAGKDNQAVFQEWTNHTGFLAALSAVTHDMNKLAKSTSF